MILTPAIVPRRVPTEDFAADGERLIYNPVRDEASALNRTAAEIWELCDGTATVGAIATVLGGRYGVEDGLLLDDVIEALKLLLGRRLIECPHGAAADME